MKLLFACVYMIGMILLLTGLFRIKKSKNPMVRLNAGFLTVMLFMGIQAVAAFAFDLVHIPINILSVGLFDFFIGCLLWIRYKFVGVQEYKKTDDGDVIGLIVGVLIVLGVALYAWGLQLNFTFFSSDSIAMHLRISRWLADEQSIRDNLYFEGLNGSIWIQILRVFLSADVADEKGQHLSQIFSMVLSEVGFFALIRTYHREKKNSALAVVISGLYFIGYPLYAAAMGFAYFSQVINIIVAILLVTKMVCDDEMDGIYKYVSFWLLLYSVFACYTLFVPIVFPAVFISLWMECSKKKRRFVSLAALLEEIKVFLLPCVLGLMNSFSNVAELKSGAGITNDGGCYFDLYSNVIWLVPFALVGAIIMLKKNKGDAVVWSGGITLLALLFAIVFNLKGRISLYYISKFYNLLWLCFFVLAYVALTEWKEYKKEFIIGIAVMVVAFCILRFSGLAETLIANNPPGYIVVQDMKHSYFPNIYVFNWKSVDMLHFITYYMH